MKQNRLILSATLVSKEPLRYSPAGIPVLNCRLSHQSEQVEAGVARSVTCEINAVAVGKTAGRLEAEQPETEWQFEGFLVTSRRYQRYDGAELHIVEYIATKRNG